MENSTPTTSQHVTFELANCKLQLRPELLFHLQQYGGQPSYLIEDELNSKYYRIGTAEYNLISLFDGTTTVARAIAQTAAQMGNQAIGESEAITICKWLIDSNLASTSVSRSADRLWESREASERKQMMQKINPITPKFSLFNPDRILTQLNTAFGWLFSLPIFSIWILVVCTGLYSVLANWDVFAGQSNQVFSVDNWIWLGFTWIGLKLIHETAHGIVCKRYGGNVRQAGVVFILLLPLPYVDVTSSWRFPSKWQKIKVAAAGMYAEVFIAAVAAIAWSQLEPGILKTQLSNIMLAGSLTTVLFNANPLMRFDGYYMLTDWLEQPNLGTNGQRFLHWLGTKYYLGMSIPKPNWQKGRGGIVATYAVCAFAWRILICVVLVFAAESIVYGAGVALAALAVAMWVLWPILKLLRFVFVGNESEQKPSAIRFCLLTTSCIVAVWAILAYVPWYSRIHAPAIVNFSERTEIRLPISGFVEKIHVLSDQVVQPDQLIATLRNNQLKADIEILRLQIKTAELRARIYKQPPRQIAAYDVEVKTLESLMTRLRERLTQQQQLEVRAPVAGQILADNLDFLMGSFVSPGHLICSIGSLENKRIEALISQHDLEKFEARKGMQVDVHLWGSQPGFFGATLDQINPRAEVELPHPAFGSTTGGPLAVKFRAIGDSDLSEPSNDFPYELIVPRFLGKVRPPESEAKSLRPGQMGTVSIRTARGTIGEVLCEGTISWFRKIRKQNQRALF